MAWRQLTEEEQEIIEQIVGKYKRYRAREALFSGRFIGIPGQPPILTDAEDTELESLLLHQELHGVLYTYAYIERLVFFFCFCLLILVLFNYYLFFRQHSW
jgi:hypothetical protein